MAARALGAGPMLLLLLLAALLPASSARRPRAVYTNHWAVRVRGGPGEADRLASAYGYLNLGQVSRAAPVEVQGRGGAFRVLARGGWVG